MNDFTSPPLSVDPKKLRELLADRRWFGSKGQHVHDATIVDLVPVKWPGSDREFAVARAEVATDAGSATYQLFLAHGDTDALEDAEFRRGLADAFLSGAAFEGKGCRWVIESEGKQPLVVPPAAPTTLASAEQSNSSIILNREAILKLYRRLEPGVHPDVEVTRFLTRDRSFVHVPVLLGTIRFEDEEGVTIAGMLQEYVRGATDGWSHALERARAHAGGAASGDADVSFARDAEQLGAITRALHETLASGDPGTEFEMQRATTEDVARWARGAAQTAEKALASLARAIEARRIPRAHMDDARRVVELRRELPHAVRAIGTLGEDAGAKTRVHGDYHLGQVLRSGVGQYLVIDFEGEPARPLRERRARHSPLKDVAGMLRSFAYAAAVSQANAGWESRVRDTFLGAYSSAAVGTVALLPESEGAARELIRLFEIEKAFYELQYELDHRPDWAWIPLRGIAALQS